jgi:hypothetical protein
MRLRHWSQGRRREGFPRAEQAAAWPGLEWQAQPARIHVRVRVWSIVLWCCGVVWRVWGGVQVWAPRWVEVMGGGGDQHRNTNKAKPTVTNQSCTPTTRVAFAAPGPTWPPCTPSHAHQPCTRLLGGAAVADRKRLVRTRGEYQYSPLRLPKAAFAPPKQSCAACTRRCGQEMGGGSAQVSKTLPSMHAVQSAHAGTNRCGGGHEEGEGNLHKGHVLGEGGEDVLWDLCWKRRKTSEKTPMRSDTQNGGGTCFVDR